jgi:hypothetical protein
VRVALSIGIVETLPDWQDAVFKPDDRIAAASAPYGYAISPDDST